MNGIEYVVVVFGIVALITGIMAYNWNKKNK